MARNRKQDTDVLAVLAALGITPEQAAAAVGAAQVAERAPRKTIEVTVLTGEDATKYGNVAISKVVNGGKSIPKMGVFTADLDSLITDLQAARDSLA